MTWKTNKTVLEEVLLVQRKLVCEPPALLRPITPKETLGLHEEPEGTTKVKTEHFRFKFDLLAP